MRSNLVRYNFIDMPRGSFSAPFKSWCNEKGNIAILGDGEEKIGKQFIPELKDLIDLYNAGNLKGEDLRKFKNMLYIMGDDVASYMEEQKRNKGIQYAG